jgi:hypothetical protein
MSDTPTPAEVAANFQNGMFGVVDTRTGANLVVGLKTKAAAIKAAEDTDEFQELQEGQSLAICKVVDEVVPVFKRTAATKPKAGKKRAKVTEDAAETAAAATEEDGDDE